MPLKIKKNTTMGMKGKAMFALYLAAMRRMVDYNHQIDYNHYDDYESEDYESEDFDND